MRILYSILIFLSLSFSSFGNDLVLPKDTVKTPVVMKPTFPDLLGKCVESGNARAILPCFMDSVLIVLEHEGAVAEKTITALDFLDSFQSLLFAYSGGMANLERGYKDGFQIYVLYLTKGGVESSSLIFLLKEGKVLEIYFL